VSVQIGSLTTAEGAISENFVYVPVGTRLTVRPHVTQDGQVKLGVNLLLSRIASGTRGGNPTFDRRETTTHVTVQDGQTVMLSGITRQEEFEEVRKLPVLGDLPLLGPLFRNTDTLQRNRELVVFLTPEVIQPGQGQAKDAMQPYHDKLDQMRKRFEPGERKDGEPASDMAPWMDQPSQNESDDA
jgi:type II secretory pathway component GspD/PulD (secretin)